MAKSHATSPWWSFYTAHGVDPKAPNQSGWCACNCVLPCHPEEDTERHGAFHITSGNYRCWSNGCQDGYNGELDRNPKSTLSPSEWLFVCGVVGELEGATDILAQYVGASPEAHQRAHKDTGTGQALQPDSPLVKEYCTSRGLTLDTLVDAGILQDDDGEALLMPYWHAGEQVALRIRHEDGTKSFSKGSRTVPYNLRAAEEDPNPDIILVTEGETDCLALTQLLTDHGMEYPVLGVPGNYWPTDWNRYIRRYGRVILVPQSDAAGHTLREELQDKTPPEKLVIVELPWGHLDDGKDVAEFLLQRDPGDLLPLLPLHPLRPQRLQGRAILEYSLNPIQWVLPNLIERGTTTLIVGAPKARKTWLAVELAVAVAQGRPWLGVDEWTPDPGLQTVFVEQEGSLLRLSQRFAHLTDNTAGITIHHGHILQADDPASLAAFAPHILQADLLILDPYASFHTQDENTVQGTQLVLRGLHYLLSINPSLALVVIHHSSKMAGGARGSSALFAGVDTMLDVVKEDPEHGDNIEILLTGREIQASNVGNRLVFGFDSEAGHYPVEGVSQVTLATPEGVLQVIVSGGDSGASREDVLDETGLSSSTVRNHLKRLEEEGRIRREGKGSKGSPFYYVATNQEE